MSRRCGHGGPRGEGRPSLIPETLSRPRQARTGQVAGSTQGDANGAPGALLSFSTPEPDGKPVGTLGDVGHRQAVIRYGVVPACETWQEKCAVP